jgi:nucleoside-diphosphate-sugar epimerase
MVKVLVTGATGFIGSHLTERLLKEGAHVRTLVRNPDRLRWLKDLSGIETCCGFLEDKDSLRAAVKGVDLIYHTAGLVKARKEAAYFRVNAEGTENLLEAAGKEEAGLKRFVYVSSQAAIGPSPIDQPLDEGSLARPITPYGRSKLKGEKAVLDWKNRFPVTIIRPPAVYGPRDVDILIYFKLASRGIVPIPGLGRRMVSLVYVEDLVQGLLLAGQHLEGAGKTFFITSGNHEWTEIANALIAAVGRGIRIRLPVILVRFAAFLCEMAGGLTRRPMALNFHKARELGQRAWLCSSKYARKILGYQPAWTLEKGMVNTAEWYRSMGWI